MYIKCDCVYNLAQLKKRELNVEQSYLHVCTIIHRIVNRLGGLLRIYPLGNKADEYKGPSLFLPFTVVSMKQLS